MYLCDMDGWIIDRYFLKFIVLYFCRDLLWFVISYDGRFMLRYFW